MCIKNIYIYIEEAREQDGQGTSVLVLDEGNVKSPQHFLVVFTVCDSITRIFRAWNINSARGHFHRRASSYTYAHYVSQRPSRSDDSREEEGNVLESDRG